MNGFEIVGTVLLSLLIGAEAGSFFEYKKKYNLYDLEKDKTFALINTLHGLAQSLIYHVTNMLPSPASKTATGLNG